MDRKLKNRSKAKAHRATFIDQFPFQAFLNSSNVGSPLPQIGHTACRISFRYSLASDAVLDDVQRNGPFGPVIGFLLDGKPNGNLPLVITSRFPKLKIWI